MRRRTRRTRPITAAALALVLSGCAVFDGGERPTLAPEQATTTTTPERTELLEPGAEPRRPVRLALTPGATATVAVRTDLDVLQVSGGEEQRLDTPAVVQTVTFTVEKVDPQGAAVSFTFDDVVVDASAGDLSDAEALTLIAELRQLVGLGGTAVMTDRGRLESVDYAVPDGLDEDVAATLEQFEGRLGGLAVPLPEEPVGAGARWRASGSTVAAGVTVEETATYEVVAMDANGVTYRFDLTQSAGEQELHGPTVPAGTEATLRSAELTGSGEGALRTGAFVADLLATTSGRQELEVGSGDDGDGPVRVRQDVTLSLSVLPAP